MSKQSTKYRLQIISGGNEQQFKNKVHNMQQRFEREKDNKLKNDGLRMEFYMNFEEWMASKFKFRSKKNGEVVKKLNNIRNELSHQLLWNGGCVVVLQPNMSFGIYTLKADALKQDNDGTPREAECQNAFNGEITVNVKFGYNGAFLQSRMWKLPGIVWLDVYLDPIEYVWQQIPTAIENSFSKLVGNVNDQIAKNENLKQIVDGMVTDSNGQIKIYNGPKIDFQDMKTTYMGDKLWENFKSYVNFMFLMRGRRTNISEKESGVAQQEILQNDENFQAVSDSYLTYYTRFCDQLNKSYGWDIECYDVYSKEELSKQQNAINDENKGRDLKEKGEGDNND